MFWLLIVEKGLRRSLWCADEANKCADALARRGAIMVQDFTIFMDPPFNVVFLLRLDFAGTMYDWFVTAGSEAF